MTTFDHILVPLDGSRLAEDILGPASYFCLRLSARMTLLHVVEEYAPHTVHGERHLATSAEAAAYLDAIAAGLRSTGVIVDSHVHERSVGDVAAAIDTHAHEFDADLIAMCKHGRSGFRQKLVVGSIAQQILRAGGTPILLTMPRATREHEPFSVRRMLIPLDSHHDAASALATAADLCRAFDASADLLTAVPSLAEARKKETPAARLLPSAAAAQLRMERDDATQSLETHAQVLADAGIVTRLETRDEDPSEAILKQAVASQSDLIVLTTHARAGFGAWYTGSTGYRVITEAKQTLLLLREL
ncbi:MAG: universal stress protein [Actinomycetota bacterium]